MKCTGECCRSFPLLDDIGYFSTQLEVETRAPAEIVPLVFVRHVVPAEHSAPAHAQFGCRAFDESTRRCSIYETRPQMCREYPYDRECRFCGAHSHDDAIGDSQ